MSKTKRFSFFRAIIGLIKLLFFLLLIATIGGFYYFDTNLKPKDSMNQLEKEIVIERGTGIKSIGRLLENENIIKDDIVFWIYCRLNEKSSKFQSGKYILNSSMSVSEIVDKLTTGIVKVDTVKFTIPEGFELRLMVQRLNELGIVEEKEFLKALNNEYSFDFLKDIPNRDNKLEGYLFPDTYEIYVNAKAETIISKMLKRFEDIYNEKYINRAKELNMTMDQVITLASIIEREAKIDKDRKIVSGVFHNRLKTNMMLQSCATVQYLLKERKDVLLYEDLEVDNPYNTYRFTGLPPGPIASPGLKSIQAALYPDDVEYLYFFALEDGSHVFSNTYRQHLNAQNKYNR